MAVGKGVDSDSKFEEVELAALCIPKVVEELCENGELFVGRGEDGVLAEVHFVFIEFKTLACMEQGKTFGLTFIFALILHIL